MCSQNFSATIAPHPAQCNVAAAMVSKWGIFPSSMTTLPKWLALRVSCTVGVRIFILRPAKPTGYGGLNLFLWCVTQRGSVLCESPQGYAVCSYLVLPWSLLLVFWNFQGISWSLKPGKFSQKDALSVSLCLSSFLQMLVVIQQNETHFFRFIFLRIYSRSALRQCHAQSFIKRTYL